MPVVTYKLAPSISTKFFNFNKFVNNLDLDLILTNPDSLTCKCNNSPFVNRHHKHIEIMFEEIFLLKVINIERVTPINLEKVKGIAF